LVAAILLAIVALRPVAGSAAEKTLTVFPASGANGCYPNGTLLRSPAGVFYGTTYSCSLSGINTVFSLTPPAPGKTAWALSVVHSFKGGTEGLGTNQGLVMDAAGALYDTASTDGKYIQGVVFRLSPPPLGGTNWTESVLHDFDYSLAFNNGDGSSPRPGLAMDAAGALYGTTFYGGTTADPFAIGFGAIFKLTPPAPGQSAWKETVLYRFKGAGDGQNSEAVLTLDNTGALYGTTFLGGKSACPPGDRTYRLRHGVQAESAAARPDKMDQDDPARLRRRCRRRNPNGKLLRDHSGALYGVTLVGGTIGCTDKYGDIVGCGTVFKLGPPPPVGIAWIYSVIHNFAGRPDGAGPQGGVIADDFGNLYGTTFGGGTGVCGNSTLQILGCGVAYRLNPPAPGRTLRPETILYQFRNAGDGWQPEGELVRDPNGRPFGVSSLGTSSNNGAIFEITP
jgi:hypothetical protein